MLVDWFTVVAQTVNFLILVWLMKRYLYRPIIKALDAREKRIAAELADADAKEADAKKERDEFKRKNDEFERQRAGLLATATDEAAAERQRLLDAARRDSDGLRTTLQESLGGEYRNLREQIAHRTQAEVFAVARKALADLAGVQLEERMADVFMQRLHGLNSDEKAQLAAMFSSPFQPVIVRSAFELAPAQRTAIENTIKETLSATVSVRFEVFPDLVSGIELVTQGQKIAWSIGDYLSSLDKDVNQLLKVKNGPEGHEFRGAK